MRRKPIVYYVISCLFQIFLYVFVILKIKKKRKKNTELFYAVFKQRKHYIIFDIYLIILLTF